MAAGSDSYTRKNFLFFYLGWWLFWSLVQTFVLHRLGLSWKISLADSVISNFLLGVLALTAILVYRYYQPGNQNRFFRFLFALGITVLFCAVLKFLLSAVMPAETEYLQLVERSMPLRFVSALMIISFITILNWLWTSLQEQKEMMIRGNESEQLVREAELVKLRQQLQPHFLFNSLNSISALAISRPEEARKMIQQLSDFLRGTLKKDEQKTVQLKEEIKQLELYLEIEKVRFGHRLAVQMKVSDEATTAQVSPLLLQPLLENAVKFGLYGTVDQVNIQLNAVLNAGMLVVSITNPFDEDSQQSGNGTGFGLRSVERRLYLLYGRNDLLETTKKEQIFITQLRIPQQ